MGLGFVATSLGSRPQLVEVASAKRIRINPKNIKRPLAFIPLARKSLHVAVGAPRTVSKMFDSLFDASKAYGAVTANRCCMTDQAVITQA